ncbi:hypothetical protein ABIA31_004210 [Catenulispora sp. MAP5-51]
MDSPRSSRRRLNGHANRRRSNGTQDSPARGRTRLCNSPRRSSITSRRSTLPAHRMRFSSVGTCVSVSHSEIVALPRTGRPSATCSWLRPPRAVRKPSMSREYVHCDHPSIRSVVLSSEPGNSPAPFHAHPTCTSQPHPEPYLLDSPRRQRPVPAMLVRQRGQAVPTQLQTQLCIRPLRGTQPKTTPQLLSPHHQRDRLRRYDHGLPPSDRGLCHTDTLGQLVILHARSPPQLQRLRQPPPLKMNPRFPGELRNKPALLHTTVRDHQTLLNRIRPQDQVVKARRIRPGLPFRDRSTPHR